MTKSVGMKRKELAASIDRDLRLLQLLQREEALDKADRSFYEFYKVVFEWFNACQYVDSPHIQIMCEHAEAAYRREIRRMVVNVPPRSCLHEDTEILMDDLSIKKIKDVQPGDKVLSFDIDTLEHKPGLVSENADNGIQETYEIILENGLSVIATDNHRFYTSCGYRYVKHLRVGDDISVLHTRYGEFHARIKSIDYAGTYHVYDIAVDIYDNFTLANGIHSHNSKSSVFSNALPVWVWLQDGGKEQFVNVTYVQDLYEQNIVAARSIIYHQDFTKKWMPAGHERFHLSADQNTKNRFDLVEGGCYLGMTPDTQRTGGFGFTFAIIDDITDLRNASNIVELKKAINFYENIFQGRSNLQNRDVIIHVQQRINEIDLSGYCLENDPRYFHLNLMAEYDPARTFISPIGFNDMREPGELIDATGTRLTPDFVHNLKTNNPMVWQSQYQQDPQPAQGNLVYPELIEHYSEYIPDYKWDKLIATYDFSFGDSPKSSQSCGLVVGAKDNVYHVVDIEYGNYDIEQQLQLVKNLNIKHPLLQHNIIEQKANGPAVHKLLQREVKHLETILPSDMGNGKETDKVKRLQSVFNVFLDHRFYLPSFYGWSGAVSKQLLAFPATAYSDIVDCIVYALFWLEERKGDVRSIMLPGETPNSLNSIYNKKTPVDFYGVSARGSRATIRDLW